MIGNYIKIILRNLQRNRFYFMINVLGLGIALACCIIAYLNYAFDRDHDRMHQNIDDVFRVVSIKESNKQNHGFSPHPLAQLLPQDIPNVTAATSLNTQSTTVKYEDQIFREWMRFTDPEFFNFFTISFLYGSAEAIKHPDQVILHEPVAKKYFGDKNPVGKKLSIHVGEDYQREVVIGGVVKELPQNNSIGFGLLSHIDNYYINNQRWDLNNWDFFASATFVRLKNPKEYTEVGEQMNRYVAVQNSVRPDWKLSGFFLDPMTETAHNGRYYRSNHLHQSFPSAAVWGPGLMAILLLITACLNFANTSISLSGKRLKEMGVRKVMGSTRYQLMFQLLSESLVIAFIALLAGMVIADWLLPIYNAMWPYLHLTADYLSNPQLLAFMLGTLLVTTFLGGAYPAFYISSFNPDNIFRGSVRFGGSNLFSRFLLGVQISISLIAIIGSITFYQNAEFQKNADMGYNREEMIVVPIDGKASFEKLRNAISQHPMIERVIGTRDHLGSRYFYTSIVSQEEEREGATMLVGKEYLDIMEFKLAEGRLLNPELKSDFYKAIINEKLQEEFQWDNPIGKILSIDTTQYTVVGVVENFIQDNFMNPIEPILMRFTEEERYLHLLAKTKTGQLLDANKYIESEWKSLFPFKIYSGYYQDEIFAEGLMISKNVRDLQLFLAIIALLLTATGLLALLTLTIQKRQKEIAIRKVLGASLGNISFLINKNYIIILIFALIAGSWVGGFISQTLVESIFDITMPFELNISLFSSGILFIIALLTILIKIYEVAYSNPAEVLKKE
ncbi:MAG: ABC transporter permease [Bacteroidota bacterium]